MEKMVIASHERDTMLIRLVKEFPILYDKTWSGHKDKSSLENAWRQISATMKVRVDDCQRRWTVLRSRYAKETRKTLSGTSDLNGREWPLLKMMSFLKCHVHRRRTFNNVYEVEVFNPSEIDSSLDIEPEMKWKQEKNEVFEFVDIHPPRNELEGTEQQLNIAQLESRSDLHTSIAGTSPSMSDSESPANTPIYVTSENKLLDNVLGRPSQNSKLLDNMLGETTSTTMPQSSKALDNVIISSVTSQRLSPVEFKPDIQHVDSIKNFCLSLYEPLKSLSRKNLTKTKIEIMQVLLKYEEEESI